MIVAFRPIVCWPGHGQSPTQRERGVDARARASFTIWKRDRLGPSAAFEAREPVFPVAERSGSAISGVGIPSFAGLGYNPHRPAPVGEDVRLIGVPAGKRGPEQSLRLAPRAAHQTPDLRLP